MLYFKDAMYIIKKNLFKDSDDESYQGCLVFTDIEDNEFIFAVPDSVVDSINEIQEKLEMMKTIK